MRYAAICLAEEVNESRLGFVLTVSRSPCHTCCYRTCDLVSNGDQARKRILLVIGFLGVIVLMAMWNALLYTNQVRAQLLRRAVVILHCRLRSYCVSAAIFSELWGV